ncbi:sarcosine oxidase subunit gamma [Candidatus Pelagibacter communis]|uniref:sarcosine oxidase subunit gamma n=1 Tax=Pelagibacter ubique TaxID=198252 RepID=UPI00094DB372|nr:sarcosine oxidase subunit gamma family protein [Candidatus Pelagibacter ubique]
MTSISSLNKVHHLGQYGNFENKDENQLIKIKEIKNIFIYQVVKFKNSKKNNTEIIVDNLNFPEVLKVNSNDQTRILWMGPENWLVISSNNLLNELNEKFSTTEFAVTDISHSRSIIELQGSDVLEVIKKGSPFDIESLKKNNCTNTVYNGITITIDNIEDSTNQIRIISLRSFGESLYHSVTDACLEYGYKAI